MQIWVVVKGAYDDEVTVGVVASQEEADALYESTADMEALDEERISTYGPFTVGEIKTRDQLFREMFQNR